MSILGNPITLGGGGSKVPDYTYTGNAEWYDEKKTILKLKTSGVLTLSKDCYADVFLVGGGGGGDAMGTNSSINYKSGIGGSGGGGNGADSGQRNARTPVLASSGVENTGGGGGGGSYGHGSSYDNGASGGSGVILIRFA